jgi:hypothetical protein
VVTVNGEYHQSKIPAQLEIRLCEDALNVAGPTLIGINILHRSCITFNTVVHGMILHNFQLLLPRGYDYHS